MKRILKLVAIAMLSMVMFSGCYLSEVDSGETGVERTFGEVSDKTIGAGLAFAIAPGTDLVIFNTKTKILEMSDGQANNEDTEDAMFDSSVSVISKNGLPIPIELTVLYRLKPVGAVPMLKSKGEDIVWDAKIIVPKVRDVARGEMSGGDIYSLNNEREKYAKNIKLKLNTEFEQYKVIVESVSIRDIGIPQKIKNSIEAKMVAKEDAEKAKYDVQKAKETAKIEYEQKAGTARAQALLSKSITPDLLKWKMLEIEEIKANKWDGVEPKFKMMGGSTPDIMVNAKDIK